MDRALLPNIFLTDAMKMLVDVMRIWDIQPSTTWIEQEGRMWQAFYTRARCFVAIKCTVSGESPPKIYCHPCVIRRKGPWEIEVQHFLFVDNTVPFVWFCEECGVAILKITWEKCARCQKTFQLYLEAERGHRYPNGELIQEVPPLNMPVQPLVETMESIAEPTPVEPRTEPAEAATETQPEELSEPTEIVKEKKKKRKRSVK